MARNSKPSNDWASLLASELNDTGKFPEGSKTVHEITDMRKAAGLSYGRLTVQRWLRELIASGKATMHPGFETVNGVKTRRVKYLLVS